MFHEYRICNQWVDNYINDPAYLLMFYQSVVVKIISIEYIFFKNVYKIDLQIFISYAFHLDYHFSVWLKLNQFQVQAQ